MKQASIQAELTKYHYDNNMWLYNLMYAFFYGIVQNDDYAYDLKPTKKVNVFPITSYSYDTFSILNTDYDYFCGNMNKLALQNGYFSVSAASSGVFWKHTATELETGFDYFGARFPIAIGSSDLSVWLSVDPLASKYPSMSPYMYTAGNPVMLVDPDGMRIDDYFNKKGKYLGSDEAKTDNVRVIKQSEWDENKTTSKDDSESIKHETGKEKSKLHSKSDVTNEASLSIYQHYNPTDLKLEDSGKNTGGASFRYTKTKRGDKITYSEKLRVNLKGNKRLGISDHANEIVNIFSHEAKHYSDYKQLGFDAYRATPLSRREARAVIAQMNHPSYNNTRNWYKKGVKAYGRKYGLIFKVALKPVKLIPLN